MELINWAERTTAYSRIRRKILNKIRGKQDIYDLINKGMKVGDHFWVGDDCSFDTSFCWLIEIGNNVTFSNKVQLVTHDSSMFEFVHRTKLGKIEIEDNAFVGARTMIMPGVRIGEGAVVAAGSLVTKDIPAHEVWGGYPAKKMMDRDQLEEKFLNDKYKCFNKEYLGEDTEMHKEILEYLEQHGRCYIL